MRREPAARIGQAALEKVLGKMSAEETRAALEALRELGQRGEVPTEKTIEDAIREARVRAVGAARVDAESVPIENERGEITTMREWMEEKSTAAELEGSASEGTEGGAEPAPYEGPNRGVELKANGDGTFGCARFRGMRVRNDGKGMVVEGLTIDDMLRPENRTDVLDLLAELAKVANDGGIAFDKAVVADAAELLLREQARLHGGEKGPGVQVLAGRAQRMIERAMPGVTVRAGTEEEMSRALDEAGQKPLKDGDGEVFGWWDGEKKECVLFRNADAATVAHEVGWHATYDWAKENSPRLYAKMRRYAETAPEAMRRLIETTYGELSPETLLDEIGAGRFEREMGGEFERVLESDPAARGWWRKMCAAITKAWRGMLRAAGYDRVRLDRIAQMEPKAAMRELAKEMAEGRLLDGSAQGGKEDGEIRFSRRMIGTAEGVYTTRIDTKNPKTKDGKNTVIFRRSPAETVLEVQGAPVLKAAEKALPEGIKVGDKSIRYTPQERTQIRTFVKKVAKAQIGNVENPDFGTIVIGRDFVREVQTHAISTAREIASVSSAREIASRMKHFAAAPNEEVKAGKNKYIEYGLAKFEFDGSTYLVMGEVGVRKDFTPYYDQRVVAKLKAESTPGDLHAVEEPISALDEMYDNRFRMLLQAAKECASQGQGVAGGKRMSIGGIYTGTAADYANRSREGGKDDGPSVKKIGTGEGSQVYGWGLYGSTVRGVAADYATADAGRKRGRRTHLVADVKYDGKPIRDIDGLRSEHLGLIARLEDYGSIDKVMESYEFFDKRGKLRESEKRDYEFLKENKEHFSLVENAPLPEHLYEQTFFTNRAEGDESHLLKWYEDLPKEQVDWIAQEFAKEGFFVASFSKLKGWTVLDRASGKKLSVWDKRESREAYEAIAKFLGSPQAASEFLARAGIDGVKYPVDSYGGKTLKDGDEAGWNYVSFRDDNIRVDHKWTDGKRRYSIVTRAYNPEARARVIDGTNEPEFANLTTAEIRNYIRDKYMGREVKIDSDGTLVEFQGESLDAALKKRGKHRRALHVLDELVKESHYTRFEENDGQKKHEHLMGQFVYTAALRLGDGVYGVELKLDIPKSDPDKTRFKGQTLKTKIADAVLSVGPRSEEPLPTSDYETSASADAVLSARRADEGVEHASDYETSAAETIRLGEIVPTQESVSQDAAGAQGENGVMLARGGRARDDMSVKADSALKAVLVGRTRVVEPAAEGFANETLTGRMAADEQWRQAETAVAPQAGMGALSMSELCRLYRAINASGALPRVLKGDLKWAGRVNSRTGRVELDARLFGIVDSSDVETIKQDLASQGWMKHEDPQWAMSHSQRRVEDMRARSELKLMGRIESLVDDRVHGRKALPSGGAGRQVLGNVVAQVIMELPETAGGSQLGGNMRKVGAAVVDALRRNPSLKQEALGAVEMLRDPNMVAAAGGNPEAMEAYKRNEKILLAEIFGYFLTSPGMLRTWAPNCHGEIVNALAKNDAAYRAYRDILSNRAGAGPHEEVMRQIEEQWTIEAEAELKGIGEVRRDYELRTGKPLRIYKAYPEIRCGGVDHDQPSHTEVERMFDRARILTKSYCIITPDFSHITHINK